MDTTSIATASMLVAVRFSIFGGKRKDSVVSQEVASKHNAEASSGDYYKNLFADSDRLDKIVKLRGVISAYVKQRTMAWGDDAVRLLPTTRFFDFRKDLGDYETQWNVLVSDFITHYQQEIAAQVFKRGSMFHSDEYPSEEDARSRFAMRVNFSPVPLSGDWRVDIGEEGKKELAEMYEQTMKDNLNESMSEIWGKLKACIERMTRQLAPLTDEEIAAKTGDRKRVQTRRKIYDSLLETPLELCSLLSDLNINADPKLEEVRKDLERALVGVNTKDLKESEGARMKVLSDVEAILAKMGG